MSFMPNKNFKHIKISFLEETAHNAFGSISAHYEILEKIVTAEIKGSVGAFYKYSDELLGRNSHNQILQEAIGNIVSKAINTLEPGPVSGLPLDAKGIEAKYTKNPDVLTLHFFYNQNIPNSEATVNTMMNDIENFFCSVHHEETVALQIQPNAFCDWV